jgi:hypothetical protein
LHLVGYIKYIKKTVVEFPTGENIFVFITMSRTALGLAQPPTQRVPGAVTPVAGV